MGVVATAVVAVVVIVGVVAVVDVVGWGGATVDPVGGAEQSLAILLKTNTTWT